MTLRARLLVGLGLLVLTAVASSGWLVLRVTRHELSLAQEADARTTGESLLHLLSTTAAETGAPLEDPRTRDRLVAMATEWRARGVVRDLIIVKDGQMIVGTATLDDRIGVVVDAIMVRRDGDSIRVVGAIRGARGDRAAARLSLPGEDLIARAVARARWLVALAALLCAGAVLLFGALWVDRVAGAVAQLAHAARLVARGELDGVKLQESASHDELSALTADFNEMTSALRRQRDLVAAQADTLVAQEKLATVGRLAAGVAHEIGNPLAAISGYADMLRSDDHETDPARRIDPADRTAALERILGESARIQTIIRELLDYSRPAPQLLEQVALADVVERAIALVRPQPRFRDVIVERRDLELPTIAAMPSRLEQIVVNLLLNAADAMEGKGTVVVEGRATDASIELAIEDTGPGIPLVDRSKVFDPFFTTKSPGQGTGLGLSISLSIAQAGGADLRLAEHQEGHGARFVLSFPRGS
ncbi:MAG: ATP-binding protein [Polyangia bacterium]